MKSMKINLFNNYGKISFDSEKIISAIADYFSELEEAGVVLVDAEEIRALNREYRKSDRATDVLTFPADGDYLGDIFICVEKVFSQAEEYGHAPEREFAFLVVHGLLHLKGYDHCTEEEESRMIAKQEEILNAINYRRNV